MGTTIIPVDLSTATVGTTGDINIPTVTSGEGYHLLLFNESGCGLKLRFLQSDDTDNIPAGGWRKYPLIPGETTVTWTVIYVLPNAPVSLLIGTTYKPGEEVPDIGTLGNSPIAIGGTVNTVGGTASSIQNDGNAAGTRIMEATVAGDGPSAVILTNDAQFTLGDTAHKGSMSMQGSLNMVGSGAGNGNVNINNGLRFYNNVSVLRLFALILAASGNPSILTSADNGQLDILKSDQSTLLARFDETAGMHIYSALNLDPTGLVDNGSTSGTATLYQLLVGNVKLVVILQDNFRNGGAAINRALPTAFTKRALCWGSNLAGLSFLSGGNAITFAQYTGIGAGGFTNTQVTAFTSSTLNELSAFDTIQYSGGNGSAHNGVMVIIGV